MLDTIFSIKFVLFVWSIFLQSNSVKHAVQNTVCVTWEPLANRNLNAKFREKDVRTFQSSIRFKLIATNWQFVKPFWSILHRFFLPKFLTLKIGLYTREAADNGKSKYLSSWRVFFLFWLWSIDCYIQRHRKGVGWLSHVCRAYRQSPPFPCRSSVYFQQLFKHSRVGSFLWSVKDNCEICDLHRQCFIIP